MLRSIRIVLAEGFKDYTALCITCFTNRSLNMCQLEEAPFVMAYGVPEFTVVGPPAIEDIIRTEAFPDALRRG